MSNTENQGTGETIVSAEQSIKRLKRWRNILATGALVLGSASMVGEVNNGNQEARRAERVSVAHETGNYDYMPSYSDNLKDSWPSVFMVFSLIGGVLTGLAHREIRQQVKQELPADVQASHTG